MSDHSDWLERFAGLRVLVVGEAMLDRYTAGTTDRFCPEHSTPIVAQKSSTDAPGGAANTAINVLSLGGRVDFLSVVGDDEEGRQIGECLAVQGVTDLLVESGRGTLLKHRLVADGQVLARFDQGSTGAIAPATEAQLIARLEALYPQCDAVIVSDYGYGVLTERVIAALAELQAHSARVITVDARNLASYQHVGVTAVKPNYQEALRLLGADVEVLPGRAQTILPHGERLLQITGARTVAVSLAEEGVLLFERDGSVHHLPARASSLGTYAPTTGAGDTFVGALTLAMAAGAPPVEAGEIAMAAAAVIAHPGTAACSVQDLTRALALGTVTPSAPTSSWERAENILCIRLDSLGDVLMTTPALRALRRPGRRLTLLTSPAGFAAASLVGELDAVLVYDAPWMKATAPRKNSLPDYAMAARLRSAGFDGAVIFTVYSQSPLPAAFLCYLAGIPLRLAHCHENPYQLLTDWIKDPEPECERHEVRRQLDLVASIGSRTADERLSVRILPEAHRRMVALLTALAVDRAHPWLVIHPGATAASRRYAPASFAAVARRLSESGYTVLFTGSDSEAELIASIQARMGVPSHSLAGRLDLAELVALVALAPVLLSNNTGPVHIAAATGTPVVDLYALTNPQHTPWQVPARVLFHDVPCKYCYKSICPEVHNHCLQLIEPETIVVAVHALATAPGSPLTPLLLNLDLR